MGDNRPLNPYIKGRLISYIGLYTTSGERKLGGVPASMSIAHARGVGFCKRGFVRTRLNKFN